MKTKVKALAAALTLVAAGQANAAISSDQSGQLGYGNGSGDLFLSVVDRNGSNPESYVRNLGITTGQFFSNPGSYLGTTFSADSNLNSVLNNNDGGTIAWNVGGFINDGTTFNVGGFTTSMQPVTTGNAPIGQAGIAAVGTELNNYVSSVNLAGTATQQSTVIPQKDAAAYYDGTYWGADWAGTINSEAGLGQSMGFSLFQVDPSAPNGFSKITTYSGDWTLGSNGTLSFGAAPAPVPLPPAVWLLGSALVGLVGIGRRRGGAPA